MAQKNQPNKKTIRTPSTGKIQDTQKPRNELNPEINGVPTSTSEKMNDKNSPDVADALKESQL